MNRFDRFISIIVLGLLAPVILTLLFWWGSLPFAMGDDQLIMRLAFSGLIGGIILDFTLLRRFIGKLYELPLAALVMVGIFYSVMIYGFFMGFPVFNAIVGILGVYIVTKRGILGKLSVDEILKNSRFIIRLSTVLLLFLCVCTAVLALGETTICAEVKGMLNLPFDVTMKMIWTLILFGGGCLLLFQYCFSKLVYMKVIKKAL